MNKETKPDEHGRGEAEKQRCPYELFVLKYFDIPDNMFDRKVQLTYADIVNVLCMFTEESAPSPVVHKSGMQWVKASERLPDNTYDLILRIHNQPSFVAVGMYSKKNNAFKVVDDSQSAANFYPNKIVEWLDESSPANTSEQEKELLELAKMYCDQLQYLSIKDLPQEKEHEIIIGIKDVLIKVLNK